MPTRSLVVDGARWDVFPSGFVTQYNQDEFGLIVVRGEGPERVMRVTRYSPQGTRSRELSLAELTDEELRELFKYSQPSFTSPELRYAPGPPGSDRTT